MGFDDKIENAKLDAEGKAREAVGEATDDRSMETEGRAKQSESDLRRAGEKVKDAFKH